MKTRIYLRVAKMKRSYKAVASEKPKFEALTSGQYTKKYFPTVSLALDLEIPDSEFEASRILLEAKIKDTKPAVELKQVEDKND